MGKAENILRVSMVENLIKTALLLQYSLDTLHLEEKLLAKGLSRKSCAPILKCYEILVFEWINYLMKTSVSLLWILKEGSRADGGAVRAAAIPDGDRQVQEGED